MPKGEKANMTKFVIDTSSFINNLSSVPFEDAIVSSLVLRELEKHKSAFDKPALQEAARHALRAIEEHTDVLTFDFNQYPSFTYLDNSYDIHYTDNRLLESLFHYKEKGETVGLLSDDLSLVLQAKAFGFEAKKGNDLDSEPYSGTLCIPVTDERVAELYRTIHGNKGAGHVNLFDMKENQYLLLVDGTDCEEEENGEKEIGAFKWTGNRFERISMNQRIYSSFFDEIKPKNFRQAIAFDSVKYNKLSTFTGKAGSGKTFIAMAYMMQQMEHYEIPINIVTDNIPLRGSQTFGLKKGEILDKILQSNLGNVMKNKIGIDQLEGLVRRELINVIAVEDIRGMSLSGILYATEVQNYSVDVLKTVLERIEDQDGFSQAILEGDQRQIDTHHAKGRNSGMARMFDVFQDSGYLGHVELKGNIRGGISALAERM